VKTPQYAKPPLPRNEKQRLQSLQGFKILDTLPEQHLNDIVFLASQICKTPIALISLVDEYRQWFKARLGFDATETPRDISFCAHAINHAQIFVIENTLADNRFRNNPLVTNKPRVRFYAGAQLKTSSGQQIGTLCVMDRSPRKLSPKQIMALEALSRQIIVHFERQKLKTDLLEKEQFLTNIVGKLPDLIAYINPDLKYTYANPSYTNWFKINPKEIVGKNVKEILGNKTFLQIKPYMKKVLQGEQQEFQIKLRNRSSGQSHLSIFRVRYIPDLRPDNKIHGFFSVINDITPIKEAENQAIQQNQKLEIALQQTLANEKSFRAIFDNSPMGITQVDSKLRLISFNSAYMKFLGYSESELKNMTALDVTHPDDIQKTSEIAKRFPKETGYLNRFERRYIHKSGKTVWGLVTSRSVQFDKRSEQYLFSVIEDVTEIREKEAQLNAAQAKLISSAKMASLGEMAGGIAHEINNPLAIIDANIVLLKKQISQGKIDQDKISTGLNLIQNTTERMAKIVRGLRSFSRDSEGDPMEVVQVSKILQETSSLCQERFRNFNVDFKVKCNSDYSIECRSIQISQIIMNLLNNSFDAVQNLKDKWISIDISRSGNLLKFTVMDSGSGIKGNVIEKMMEPFFTTKEVGKGTGLGLSISKGIAESHHGKLRYDSSKSNTCFILEIPLTQPKP